MEKIETDRSKWSYVKATAWSGTLGLIVGIVYTVVNLYDLELLNLQGGL
jgi:hypothetical protein